MLRKTEEVINWIKKSGYKFVEITKEYGYMDLDSIIGCLERGGKYEAVVKDIENDFKKLHCNIMSENSFNIIKQKHFPKTEKWERFINVDFAHSESIIVKMIVTKNKEGNIIISYEPQYKESDILEKGGDDYKNKKI